MKKKLGKFQKKGWKAPLTFYAVLCPIHGWYVDYPHGPSEYFTCPECFEEAKKHT